MLLLEDKELPVKTCVGRCLAASIDEVSVAWLDRRKMTYMTGPIRPHFDGVVTSTPSSARQQRR